MDTLKSIKKPITTTELAKDSNIDIKNITRYLKALESEYLIKRETIQNGKIRLVMVSLTTRKEIDTTRKIKDKIDITSKKTVKIEESEKAPILMKDINEKEIVPISNFVGYKKVDKEYNPPVEAYMSAYYNLTGSTFRAKKPVKINTLKEIKKIISELIKREENR